MKRDSLRLLAFAYVLAVLVVLLVSGVRTAKGAYYEHQGLRQHLDLPWQDLEQVSIRPVETQEEGVWYVSSDVDPQLIWRQNVYLETVQLKVHRTSYGYTPALYWLEEGQTDFTEAQMVYGVEMEPDTFLFDLGGRKVTEIRIDPDSAGGVITRFDGLQINPWHSFTWAFHFGWKGVLCFLALPLLAVALIKEMEALLKK